MEAQAGRQMYGRCARRIVSIVSMIQARAVGEWALARRLAQEDVYHTRAYQAFGGIHSEPKWNVFFTIIATLFGAWLLAYQDYHELTRPMVTPFRSFRSPMPPIKSHALLPRLTTIPEGRTISNFAIKDDQPNVEWVRSIRFPFNGSDTADKHLPTPLLTVTSLDRILHTHFLHQTHIP
jgi:hypothetical protein